MNFHEFKLFVHNNIDLLRGVHPESANQLAGYEASLGFPLPESMKWLLSTHGYTRVCGVENLEDSVKVIQESRSQIKLPHNVLIINDWNDGGVIFAFADDRLDADYEIIWGDAADLHGLSDGIARAEGNERFENFAGWVASRVRFERENG